MESAATEAIQIAVNISLQNLCEILHEKSAQNGGDYNQQICRTLTNNYL